MNDTLATTRVSVVIPNYNYARHLEACIGSVMAQTHQPIDIVVVDDGSTDDSCAIIEALLPTIGGERKARFFPQRPNAGKLAALNAVMHEISNPYMLTLDADDILEPDYINHCLQVMHTARQENPRTGFVYSDCTLIDSDGTVLDRGRSTTFDAKLLQTHSFIPEPALCVSEAFLEVMPFDTSILVGTKHHKWLRMVANGWVGQHIPEPLFRYRMHTGNLSGIGKRVLAEKDAGKRGERILSGYWVATHL
ncbi:MAG: glycosyltransferase family A protein [Pseudomonadales bacterium]|nr:glycosyltransferase family A protein [Pseudomonadales bacterium]